MKRTQNRALVSGIISPRNAIIFAILLGLIGAAILFRYTNLLTLFVAVFGFFVYVILYSFLKRKTSLGTAIGSIAGGVPPVVGYCAASNNFDAGAMIFFAMLILWQMPHFFAIAIYRFDDYAKAGIPVLPIKKGMQRTKWHMILYIIAFIIASILLTVFDYTGYLYLSVAILLGMMWLILCLKGFKGKNDDKWARQMFQMSLLLIVGISLAILAGPWI
jgi:heme o synthase